MVTSRVDRDGDRQGRRNEARAEVGHANETPWNGAGMECVARQHPPERRENEAKEIGAGELL